MSVIENALRRAQDQQATQAVPLPSPVVLTPAAEATAPSRQPAAPARTGSRRRYVPSVATVILVVLTIATVVILRQPDWGRGFQRWLPVTPDPEVAEIVPRYTGDLSAAPAGAVPPAMTQPASMTKPTTPSDSLYQAPTAAPVKTDAGTSIMSPMPAGLTGLTEPASAGAARGSNPARSTPAQVSQGGVSPPVTDVQSRFRVSGIMLSGRTRMAVINGAIVAEGERIENAIVRAVDRQSVTIEIGGRTYHLGLRGAN
ncbi:MAG TPA: hypothetical protein P5572_18405 [Phycisphaerae bacterium]|nr:hypothetical protein [Phycisphaerales bacterium]HRX87000.1 hypothetical protein [Phycisphaerae bacterium]